MDSVQGATLSDCSTSNSTSLNERAKDNRSNESEEVLVEASKNNVFLTKDHVEDDFLECKIGKKIKTTQTQKANSETFICVVCRVDLTSFDLEKRTVHMNQCIDYNSSTDPDTDLMSSDTFILECPLCFRNFPSPEVRSAHIKKCGKSRGLSVQSVIQALQLQEKHFLERRALGLPLNKIKQSKAPKKPSVKRFTVEPKSAMQSDLQLAKALSLSLESNGSQASQSGMLHLNSEGSSTLTSLQPPSDAQVPGRAIPNKRVKLNHTPLLLTRTEEERNKILLDKVNAVIMPQGLLENETENEEMKCIQAEGNALQVPFLWSLSGKAESRNSYYVEQLIDWIVPSDVDAGSKLCNLSQIPGHHIYTQLPCDYTFSSNSQIEGTQIKSADTASPSLISGLRSLIGNSWMSDIDIHTASGIVIPAHKLILAVRCPILKKEFDDSSNKERYVLDMKNNSFDAVLHFLNFIYTGSTEWKEDIIDELSEIAKKFDVKDLINILESDSGTLELMSIQNTQIVEESSVKSCAFTPQTSPEKINIFSDDQTEVNSLEPINSSNKFKSSNLGSSKEWEKPVGIEETSEALSVCDDILNKLTNCAENSYFESEKTDEIYPGFSSHDKHNDNKLSTVIVGIDAGDNSSSNDSCKVIHVSYNSEEVLKTREESSHSCSESDWISERKKKSNEVVDEDRARSFKVKSPRNSPAQRYEEFDNMDETSETSVDFSGHMPKNYHHSSDTSETENPTDADVVIVKDIQNNSLSQNSRHSVIHFEDSFPSKFNRDSVINSPSTGYCRSPHSLITPPKNRDNLASESPNISLVKSKSKLNFETVTIDSYPSYSERFNYSMEFENKNLTSPEVITCDSEDDLNTPLNNYSLCESPKTIDSPLKNSEYVIIDKKYSSREDLNSPMKKHSFSQSTKSVSSYSPIKNSKNEFIDANFQSDVNVVLLDSDEPNIDSENYKLSSSFSKDDNTKVNSIHCSPSQSFVLRTSYINNNAQCEDVNNEPEVIIFDSDEEDVPFKIIPTVESNDIEEKSEINTSPALKAHKYKSFNDQVENRDLFVAIQNHERLTIENNHNVDSMIPFEVSSPDSKVNKLVLSSDLKSSPESPWVYKSKKSLDDFKTSDTFQQKRVKSVKENECSIQTKSVRIQDSLPSSLNKAKQKSNINNLATPNSARQQFKLSDSPITPFPDYQNMVTPEIKEALKKIGVKALPKKKAVAILAHVYEETHPVIGKATNSESEIPTSQLTQVSSKLSRTKKSKADHSSQKRKRSNEKVDNELKKPMTVISSPTKCQSDESCFSSPDAKNPKKKKSDYLSLSSDFSDSSQPESREKVQQVSDYIMKNDAVYTQILTYMPINLVEFQKELKDNGITVGIQKLMDYFDEQCITFHLPRKEEYRKKQQVRTQRFRKRMIAKLSQKT